MGVNLRGVLDVPLAGHAGSCNRVTVAAVTGRTDARCDCGAPIAIHVSTIVDEATNRQIADVLLKAATSDTWAALSRQLRGL